MATTKKTPEALTLPEITAALERCDREQQLAEEEARILQMRLNHAKALVTAGRSGENLPDLERDLAEAQQHAAAAIAERETLNVLLPLARYHELRAVVEAKKQRNADIEAEYRALKDEYDQATVIYDALSERLNRAHTLYVNTGYSIIVRAQTALDQHIEAHREQLEIAGVLPKEAA